VTIFHIAHASDWDAALAEGEYRTSTRGLGLDTVGFIHASSAAQVPGVAEAFYRDDPEALVVLEIAEDGLDVRWEDGGAGELFPHVYGPIPVGSVNATRSLWFEDDGGVVLDP
jgi:uncharacterized protein (DUF952 family)